VHDLRALGGHSSSGRGGSGGKVDRKAGNARRNYHL
jgi:hypothetical protein